MNSIRWLSDWIYEICFYSRIRYIFYSIDFLSELRANWILWKMVNAHQKEWYKFIRRKNKFRIHWTIWMKIKCLKNFKRKWHHQKINFNEQKLYWVPNHWHQYCVQLILAYDLLAHEIILRKLLLFNAFFVWSSELRTIVPLFLVAKSNWDIKKSRRYDACAWGDFFFSFCLNFVGIIRHKKSLNINVKIKTMKFAWIQVKMKPFYVLTKK